MANNFESEEMRYGISALSTKYKDVAEPDELLVREKDGKMFYKREDGQIVTASQCYDRKSLISDVLASGIDVYNKDSSLYMAYHTVDITGKTNLLNTINTDLVFKGNTSFSLPTGKESFCIRIHGSDIVDTIADFTKLMYEKKHPEDTDPDLTITLRVTKNGSTNIMELSCKFNKLMYINLGEGACSVEVTNIRCQKLAKAFNSLTGSQRTAMYEFNVGNRAFEATTIDVVTFIKNINDTPIYTTNGEVQLQMLIPVEALIEESYSTGGTSSEIILSKEQPDRPCIWGKLTD